MAVYNKCFDQPPGVVVLLHKHHQCLYHGAILVDTNLTHFFES